MCGIVGAIIKGGSGFYKKTEDSFFEMLYVDALRGFDSTGVIAVENTGAFHIAKEATEATWFVPQVKGGPIGRDMFKSGKAYIGHNRKKTMGGIKDDTAHPFVVDDTFAMVHNGTLVNHKALADTETDSQALTKVIKEAFDKDDYVSALNDTLGKVYGAYALAMYDQKKELVHLLRNNERPLWVVEADDATFFGSEVQMITWILCRNGYDYTKLKIKQVPEHTLISYDLQKNTVKEEKLEPKKTTPKLTTSHGTPVSASNTGSISGTKVTKQLFKFFKRKWIGKRISFWVDDYIEANYPREVSDGETELLLFARDEDIKEMHSISATCDLAAVGQKDDTEVFETRWTGIVTEVLYNEQLESVVLTVPNCKPIIASIDSARTLFEESLSKKSLITLSKELKSFEDHMVTWQREMYEAAIKQRQKELERITANYHKLGLEAALETARKAGVEVVSEIRGNKTVYFDDTTNEVIYEMPVVLH